MSASRFTRSSGPTDDRFVCSQVNGIIITSNSSSRRSATVRLIPSTAIDPLRTMNGASADGNWIVIQCASPAARIDRRCPTPSTWPCTKWPPKRLSARMERSRLIVCPGLSLPSVVTRTVSGPMSACRYVASRRVAVRHTPFTDTLSPSCSSGAMAVAIVMCIPPASAVTASRRPTLSMRPVNIAFDQHVRSEHFHIAIDERRRGDVATRKHRYSSGPEPHGRYVHLEVVHDPRVPHRSLQRRPTFHQEALDVARGKRAEAISKITVARADHRGTAPLQCVNLRRVALHCLTGRQYYHWSFVSGAQESGFGRHA